MPSEAVGFTLMLLIWPRRITVSAEPRAGLNGTPLNDMMEVMGCEPINTLRLRVPAWDKSIRVPPVVTQVSSSAGIV
jgi:hypothetical protein